MSDPWEIYSEVTAILMPESALVGFNNPQQAIRDAMPQMAAQRGGIEYLRPGDPGYDEMIERGRRKKILEQALARICTCPKHPCPECDCRSETCIVHGWDLDE